MNQRTIFLGIVIGMIAISLGCRNAPNVLERQAKEEPHILQLWPKRVLDPSAGPQTETIQPDKGDHVIRLTNVTDPSIQVFQSIGRKSPTPGVLICPGGGYAKLSMNKEGTEIAEWLNSLGITAIVLKYRVPDQRERAFEDIQRALRIIRFHAAVWNIDPNRIGVMGFSAGGHLAARLSGNSSGKTYESVDEIDTVTCRPDFSILIYPAYLVDKENHLNPEIRVGPDNPPVFLLQTQDDRIGVENSVFYYMAAKQTGILCEIHVFPRGGHGYGIRSEAGIDFQWHLLCEEWLRREGILKSRLDR